MRVLHLQRIGLKLNPFSCNPPPLLRTLTLAAVYSLPKPFSNGGNWNDKDADNKATTTNDLGWDLPSSSSWSTGLTKEHFDGEVVGHQVGAAQPAGGGGGTAQSVRWSGTEMDMIKELEAENRVGKAFVDGWSQRLRETSLLLKQVREPGARGLYLKDSEKTEMYKKHKENPKVYTVEKLAKEYRIMRQRVHAILWLKELEEEEEKKLGCPLDDSVELLLDNFPK